MADAIDVHPNFLLTEPELLRKLKRHVASVETVSQQFGAPAEIRMNVETAKRLIAMAERANLSDPQDVTPAPTTGELPHVPA